MRSETKILLLEDNALDAELFEASVRGIGHPVQILRVESEPEFSTALNEYAPDLIVSDFSLPAFDGLSALKIAVQNAPDVPFIFLSGTIGEERAVEALHRGAVDYVLKDKPERLIPVITRALKEARDGKERRHVEAELIARDITQRKLQSDRLDYLNCHDILTGLINRAFLETQLTEAVARAERTSAELAVLSIDLNNFKVVNDSSGHTVGDAFLKLVSARLLACTRPSDILARYAADQFVLVSCGPDPALALPQLVQKILDTVKAETPIDGYQFNVTCSIGVSTFPQDGTSAAALLRSPDIALHRAKEAGCDSFRFYAAEMQAGATERLRLDTALRRAFLRTEFSLAFQPKVRLADRSITGFEALLRWTDPALGPISPGRFVPILEQNGLITEVGEWVLACACEQIRQWRAEGLDTVPIAVNVSIQQLADRNFSRRLDRLFCNHQIDPINIELEITESVLMQNPEQVVGSLNYLRDMGIQLSVDDFGTGYSSLSYLRIFPITSLKVDRSFIRDTAISRDAALITQAIISMAHDLRLKVVAEGVETAAQVDFLETCKCDEVQGYYFARPMDATSSTALLRNGILCDTQSSSKVAV